MLTLAHHPITQTEATIRARIGALGRALDRAEAQGEYLAALDYRDALDACERELAERGAREPDALARSLDAYTVTIDDVWERR